jgi:putative hydrolase of the HAD superfamily
VAIRAFLFDFDGLILDTETASRAGWEWLYREHGHELPEEKWALVVGTTGAWSPMDHLEALVGEPLHLARLEREVGWDAILTADGDHSRAKPNPILYTEALELLGVRADEAVVFEDSPNGVRAGKAAGIFTVAIPNSVTRDYGLDEADLVVDSLADLPPDDLLARFS